MAPCLRLLRGPGRRRLLGSTFDHVEKTSRSPAPSDQSQVNDDGDVLAAMPGGTQAQRLVRETTHDHISCRTFTPATSTPLIRISDTPCDKRAISFESLPGRNQSQFIESAKHAQVGAAKPAERVMPTCRRLPDQACQNLHPWKIPPPIPTMTRHPPRDTHYTPTTKSR